MGKCTSLFFSSNYDGPTLYKRIIPSDEQIETQQARWNELRDKLIQYLKDKTGYNTSSWLQGSYKFGTQIRPVKIDEEYDIDLGTYVEWVGDPENGSISPKKLMNLVQDCLYDFEEDNDDVIEVTNIKQRCCRIRFEDNFHIDVPSYHLDPTSDQRSLATKRNRWEDSDPKAIYLWFKEKFDDYTRAKVRRQIRYLKTWSQLKCDEDTKPSSILLTVLIAEAYERLSQDESACDDECIQHIAEQIYERLQQDTEVVNPVNDDENINRLGYVGTNDFCTALEEFIDIANRANEAESTTECAEIWSEAFDHFFPIPDDDDANSEAQTLGKSFDFIPQVRVTATTKSSPQRTFEDNNKIGPIPKNCDIKFELLNSDELPWFSKIRWIVRNNGEEADKKNDMGHLAGKGSEANENSAYKGTHYMDVSVTKSGKLLGRRRIPVKIHGQAMPNRQLPRRRQFVSK